jgi:hypothetical protein
VVGQVRVGGTLRWLTHVVEVVEVWVRVVVGVTSLELLPSWVKVMGEEEVGCS